ncbi:MAG: hypothetical protein M3463_17620 [Verrucomicrobiota bacterium]|nr:hypothetical protein [Verrucomicrobiota bacterium]
MKLAVRATELFVNNLRARMPFRYGIVTMTRVPHLLLRLSLEIDGRVQHGFAADNLAPKWFTKDPNTSYCDDLRDMIAVIRHACEAAREAGAAESVFALWQQLYAAQKEWAAGRGFPPLLWGFGVSWVERAVIDAFCRARGVPFGEAVRTNALGVRLDAIYPELAGTEPRDFLPPAASEKLIVRHTVGVTDPLTDPEIPEGERAADGLPQSLQACIRAYRVFYFKIKLSGDAERDRARLHRILGLLEGHGTPFALTLDGNENYHAVPPFRELWESFMADAVIARFLDHLLFFEQPLHRDVALSAKAADELLRWPERPSMIIDESDAEAGTLAHALESGYAGTSHKNCKGVFKSIANASLIAHRQRRNPGARLHMSAEDLTNVGPVALLQDLAAVAALGIPHVERNGHHYFAGLSEFPAPMQRDVLAAHGDLYTAHPSGFPVVRIADGRLRMGSIIAAPFGLACDLDAAAFERLEDWSYDSLFGEAVKR